MELDPRDAIQMVGKDVFLKQDIGLGDLAGRRVHVTAYKLREGSDGGYFIVDSPSIDTDYSVFTDDIVGVFDVWVQEENN